MEFLKAGPLSKQGGSRGGRKSWKTRWFVLEGISLLYFKSQKEFIRGTNPLGSLPVLGMATREVEMSNNGGYSFVLMATDRTMAVSAQSAQERQEWMLLLAKAQMYTQDELPQPSPHLNTAPETKSKFFTLSRAKRNPVKPTHNRYKSAGAIPTGGLLQELEATMATKKDLNPRAHEPPKRSSASGQHRSNQSSIEYSLAPLSPPRSPPNGRPNGQPTYHRAKTSGPLPQAVPTLERAHTFENLPVLKVTPQEVRPTRFSPLGSPVDRVSFREKLEFYEQFSANSRTDPWDQMVSLQKQATTQKVAPQPASPQMRKSSITSIQSDSSISSIGSGMLNAMDFDEKFLAMLQSNCKGGGTQESRLESDFGKVDEPDIQGPIGALVDLLPLTASRDFRDVFLLFSHCFISTDSLLAALINRFNDSVTLAPQLGVYDVLFQWVFNYPEDFDTLLHRQLGEFVEKCRELTLRHSTADGDGKITLHSKVMRVHEKLQCTSPAKSPLPTLPSVREVRVRPVTEFSPRELAEALTEIDHELFMKIAPREFVNKAWTRVDKSSARHLTRVVTSFNDTSRWVSSCILREEDCNLRTKMIKLFVRVAFECISLCNYHAVFTILCGLSLTPVFRLKRNWNALSSKFKALFSRLKLLTSTDKNYQKYRNLLKKTMEESSMPHIPHLAVVLKDLFVLQSQDYFDENNNVVWNNFKKQYYCLLPYWVGKRSRYSLNVDAGARVAVHKSYRLRSLTDTQMFDQSYFYEPTKSPNHATSPTCKSVVGSFKKDWLSAGHPALSDQIGEGKLSESKYAAWLNQQKLWFEAIDEVWNEMVRKSPVDHRSTLKQGQNLCRKQVHWFSREMSTHRVDTMEALPETQKYIEEMHSLMEFEYPIMAFGMWNALELTHMFWASAMSHNRVPIECLDQCETFGTEQFESLCRDIAKKADFSMQEIESDRHRIFKESSHKCRNITHFDRDVYDAIERL